MIIRRAIGFSINGPIYANIEVPDHIGRLMLALELARKKANELV